MRSGKDLLNKPIYSLDEGRLLGRVQDLYLDEDLRAIMGIFLGSQGLIKRKSALISRRHIVLFGIDIVLVANSEAVTDDRSTPEAKEWLTRQQLLEREVDTPGGTKLGRIGDVVLDENGRITSFRLSRVFVEGPLAAKQEIGRGVVLDTGAEDGRMTVNLNALELQLAGEPYIEILDQPTKPTGPGPIQPPDTSKLGRS